MMLLVLRTRTGRNLVSLGLYPGRGRTIVMVLLGRWEWYLTLAEPQRSGCSPSHTGPGRWEW